MTGVGDGKTEEDVDWNISFPLVVSREDRLRGWACFLLALPIEDSFLLSMPHLALIVGFLLQLLLPD